MWWTAGAGRKVLQEPPGKQGRVRPDLRHPVPSGFPSEMYVCSHLLRTPVSWGLPLVAPPHVQVPSCPGDSPRLGVRGGAGPPATGTKSGASHLLPVLRPGWPGRTSSEETVRAASGSAFSRECPHGMVEQPSGAWPSGTVQPDEESLAGVLSPCGFVPSPCPGPGPKVGSRTSDGSNRRQNGGGLGP